MAELDDNSLIGYDPLAWMLEETDARESPSEDTHTPITVATETVEIMPSDDETSATVESLDVAEPETAVDDEPQVVVVAQAGGVVESCQIVLEAVQNIQNVGLLHDRLIRALDGDGTIEIDASAVTQIDTASLQLLLILKQTAIKLQKEVVIDFPSDRFIEAAELLGLAEMLEVDQAAAGFF